MDGRTTGKLLNAGIGAVVTVVLSFTGISPLLGGGVAGYLGREDRTAGAKVGALSGAPAFLPLLLAVLLFGLLAAGPMRGGGPLPGGPELLVVPFVALPFALLWNAGLGALGGYAGIYVREEYD